MSKSAADIIAIAKAEVGTHEGRSNGHWNNHQKYSPDVPGLEWSQGQPWCATFVSWCAMKAGVPELFPVSASTDLGASWFKKRKQWSLTPSIGAQVFYGRNGDMDHTGLVYDYDDTYIYVVEGNTNDGGSREGDGVYLKKRLRRDSYVQGYGVPAYDKPAQPAKTLGDIAREVIDGKWGNGTTRVKRLRAAGHDPRKVQAEVNKILRKK